MSDRREDKNNESSLDRLRLRDEILQVMYWMMGEGFGREFAAAELQKFIEANDAELAQMLEQMAAEELVSRTEDGRFTLTKLGQREGGRRFADEFEDMTKPGHYECDEPDCDCHSADSIGECKHLLPSDSSPR